MNTTKPIPCAHLITKAITCLSVLLCAVSVVRADTQAPAKPTDPHPPGWLSHDLKKNSSESDKAGPRLYSFHAEDLDLKKALALFARANHLNIVPDQDITGTLTVDFSNLPLDLAMQAILDAHGYYFVKDHSLIRVRNRETRMFQVDYIQATRTGSGSNAVQISSGATGSDSSSASGSSGGSSSSSSDTGSSMTVTASSKVNFWQDLKEQLGHLISKNGSFTVNSLSGTIEVTDSHRNVERIADFLSAVSKNVVRQIDLDVEIYEVSFTSQNQLGIDWTRVAQSIDKTVKSTVDATTTITNPIYGGTPGSSSLHIEQTYGETSAILQALEEQGNLKVVSKPRLRTLNNQPAVIRVGQDLPVFTRSVTLSQTNPPVQTVTEDVQTVTVGTILSITPQVSASGLITLDITPAVSRLVRQDTSPDGTTSAPVIDIRQSSSIVRMRTGETIVLGGLVQESTSHTQRKVPLLGDIPFVGRAFRGDFDTKTNNELVIFLTPRVINP